MLFDAFPAFRWPAVGLVGAPPAITVTLGGITQPQRESNCISAAETQLQQEFKPLLFLTGFLLHLIRLCADG